MRWLSHKEAQAVACGSPDAQRLAFRLPGHLPQHRVEALARHAFGHRALVERDDTTWVVVRHEFRDARYQAQLAKRRRQQQQLLRRVSLKASPHSSLRRGR